MVFNFVCLICGKEFTDKKRQNRKTCSRKCQGEYAKINYSGKNSKLYGRKLTNEHKLKIKLNSGNRGKPRPEEVRKKIGDAQRGEKNHHYGVPNSLETRRKIVLSHLRRRLEGKVRKKQPPESVRKTVETRMRNGSYNPSMETRKKISISNKGRTFTEEHRRKLSLASIGRKLSSESRKKLSESIKKYFKEHPITFKLSGKYEKEILDKLQDLIGFSIKRQFFINGYYVDGYCQELNLAIEVDEKYHFKNEESIKKDKIREQEIIKALNCKFLRIKESDYLKNRQLAIPPEYDNLA